MISIIIFRRRLNVFEGSQKQRAGVFMPKKIRFSLRKTRRAARSSCLLIRIRTFPVTNRMKQHTFGAPESINCLFSFFENRVRSALEIGSTRRTVAMRGSRGPGRRWLAPSILPTRATLSSLSSGGQALPRFLNDFDFSPKDDAKRGQRSVFNIDEINHHFPSQIACIRGFPEAARRRFHAQEN